jgi:hypothetical protein
MMCYLHTTVKHMSIVSVLRARQHELLTAEVAELRKRLDARELATQWAQA